ncbi:hypothetical protein BDP27DRAFT_1330993 [Rhodocollybia butyracea]|uniref:Uncharacterized protein n=1 Tax=Rhodocollybia butyracea TaxID=206335 RepID=A0A9P5PN17_9AGAR|nr:hypothetical protein BDP27DRAFT_1330993 [Rhodocollybia butyracea]
MANGKGKRKVQSKKSSQNPPPLTQCATLNEDEITRCDLLAANGAPRCKVHQAQYRKMYTKYKEAGKVVDELKVGREMPSLERITQYSDVHSTLEQARWIRRYLEAIRVERAGRDIHQRRFFAKADDGHKFRLIILEKRMVKAVEILDALQARAFDLHMVNNPAREWVKDFQKSPLDSDGDKDDLLTSTDMMLKSFEDPKSEAMKQQRAVAAAITGSDTEEEADLIDIELRAQKTQLLYVFEFLLSEESIRQQIQDSLPNEGVANSTLVSLARHTFLQYFRRIVMHDPVLSMKAINKVSPKDLILDEDFALKDAARVMVLLAKRLQIGLLWWKDSLLEAIAITRDEPAAKMGDPKNRFRILGGWVFNTPHSGTMSDEGWGTLLETLGPLEKDMENRFVRLCNTFDDLISYLSFGALGLFPPPTFCSRPDPQGRNAVASRNHLSLSGVVIADMVTGEPQLSKHGLVPTPRRGRNPGCIIWAEVEKRAYIFGAVRDKPDAFTNAFISGLRARPDLFQVVIYSETDPVDKVECSGFGGEALPALRTRTFEAGPPSPSGQLPSGYGAWDVRRSASDVLHGKNQEMLGYLTQLTRPGSSGWFFHFKKMPVKYFVILDTTPHRHPFYLAREVAWVALCVQGFGEGECSDIKYAKASDKMFQKRAEERLSWKPKGSWHATKMADS